MEYLFAWLSLITICFIPEQVFGMECVMLPCYSLVVFLKVCLALRLALDPNNLSYLFSLFFIHHIYVWCRAYVTIFEGIGIFGDETYSISIFIAGFTMAPLAVRS